MVGDTGFEPVTSSVSGKRATTAPIARAVLRGEDGIRTRVHGFAGRCLASRPLHRSGCLRADDETRTRDPNLGKVVRYQLRYIRIALNRTLKLCHRNCSMLQVCKKREENSPRFSASNLLSLVRILTEAVGSLTVNHDVDACNLFFALHPESNGLLNREANDEGDNE